MKIITSHISDTHNDFRLQTGEGHILFHHGDATNRTYLSEMDNLNQFFKKQLEKFDYIVYTPGNHDLLFQDNESQARSMIDTHNGRVRILINQATELFEFKIYGTPFSMRYGNYAFQKDAGDITEEWNKIPLRTEILISHGPPYGILDYIPGEGHVGSNELMYKTENLSHLLLHGFGHIHEGNGVMVKNGVTYLNAATAGDYHRGPFNAWIVDWDEKKITNIERIEK